MRWVAQMSFRKLPAAISVVGGQPPALSVLLICSVFQLWTGCSGAAPADAHDSSGRGSYPFLLDVGTRAFLRTVFVLELPGETAVSSVIATCQLLYPVPLPPLSFLIDVTPQ